MRLRWAKTLMIGQCFACFLAAFCFYIYISSVHVIMYKNVVPARLQNTSRLTMCQLRIFAKFASGWLLAGRKFHSVSRQPDTNFIQSVASRMQISFSWLPFRCKFHSFGRQPDANCIQLAAMQYKIPSLHAASNQPNEICILLAASQMQILQK